MELCRQYNFKCKFTASDLIFITTNIGSWRLICGQIIKIYHNNYKPGMGVFLKKHGKFREGFHQQSQIQTDSIKKAIQYIHNHEKSYLKAGNFAGINRDGGKR